MHDIHRLRQKTQINPISIPVHSSIIKQGAMDINYIFDEYLDSSHHPPPLHDLIAASTTVLKPTTPIMSPEEENTNTTVIDNMITNMTRYLSLEGHQKLETIRARAYYSSFKNDIDTEIKLNSSKYRVKLLDSITRYSFEYTFLSGRDANKNRIEYLPALPDLISGKDAKILVDVMVDVDSKVWEDASNICKAYSDNTGPSGDRNKFRNKRRGLWNTAVKVLQNDREALLSAAKMSTATRRLKNSTSSFIFEDGQRNTPRLRKNASKEHKAQYNRWMRLFNSVREELECGAFLNNNFKNYTSRTVEDCPVLSEAHKQNNRKFISTNRDSICSCK